MDTTFLPRMDLDEPGDLALGGTTPHALLVSLIGINDKEDSLVGRIAVEVAQDIIEGELGPGYDLNSIDLAERFGTSRTPVREALLLLEKGGLVDIPARRRPRVVELSAASIAEIYTFRAELYALVAQRVAVLATVEQIAVLSQCLDRMRLAATSMNFDNYFWNNVLFHEQAAGFAQNPPLKRSIDGLGLQVLQLRHKSLSSPGRIEKSVEDHTRLLRAFVERDKHLASALCRSIILSAKKSLEEFES